MSKFVLEMFVFSAPGPARNRAVSDQMIVALPWRQNYVTDTKEHLFTNSIIFA